MKGASERTGKLFGEIKVWGEGWLKLVVRRVSIFVVVMSIVRCRFVIVLLIGRKVSGFMDAVVRWW